MAVSCPSDAGWQCGVHREPDGRWAWWFWIWVPYPDGGAHRVTVRGSEDTRARAVACLDELTNRHEVWK